MKAIDRASAPCVAHVVDPYLFLTGTWIYGQIVHLGRWRPIVLCKRTQNLDAYPVERLYALRHQPFPVLAYNKLASLLLGYYPYFRQALACDGAKIIHAHFGPSGFQALRLAESAGLPLITTFYGFDLSRLPARKPQWRSRYQRLFKSGALFLVEGSHMRQQLVALGCPPEKAIVQHLGIDLGNVRFEPRRPDGNSVVRILVAGTFTEKKGIPYAVEAFARVRQMCDNVRLTVIGDARNRPDEQEIKKEIYDIVKRYGVEDSVVFMGYQPHTALVDQYYRHHLLVSPSVQARDGDNEGGAPVTIIEASAAGMPIVSTWHCDIPEAVKDSETGFLVPERDIDALVEKILVLVQNPQVREDFGRKGHAHVARHYDVRKQADRLELLYDSVFQNKFAANMFEERPEICK